MAPTTLFLSRKWHSLFTTTALVCTRCSWLHAHIKGWKTSMFLDWGFRIWVVQRDSSDPYGHCGGLCRDNAEPELIGISERRPQNNDISKLRFFKDCGRSPHHAHHKHAGLEWASQGIYQFKGNTRIWCMCVRAKKGWSDSAFEK